MSDDRTPTEYQRAIEDATREGAVILPRAISLTALCTLLVVLGGGVTAWALLRWQVSEQAHDLRQIEDRTSDHEGRIVRQEERAEAASTERDRIRAQITSALERIERQQAQQTQRLDQLLRELRTGDRP